MNRPETYKAILDELVRVRSKQYRSENDRDAALVEMLLYVVESLLMKLCNEAKP